MQILGIHIDKPFLRAAILEKKGDRYEIFCLKSPFFDDPENVKQLYTHPFKGKIVSSLFAKDLLVRSFELKTCPPRHLEEVIAFQSQSSSFLNAADFLSVPYIVGKNKETTDILLLTASRGAIRDHLLALESLKIDPDFVTAAPLALLRYAQWKNPGLQDVFLIDLGSEEWTCICMEKGVLKQFSSTTSGVEALLAALWEDRKKVLFQKEVKGIAKQIDLLQLKSSLNPHLSAALHSMRQEIEKMIYSFSSLFGPKPLLFTGRTDAFGHLKEYLMENIKDSTSMEISFESSKEEQKYETAIGLALLYSPKEPQFRREEFFPKKFWRQAGKRSLFLIAASFTIALGLIGSVQFTSKSRKIEMVSLLKNALKKQDPVLSQTLFSLKSEEEILRKWERAVSTHSKQSPYFASYPKVTEVLSWLYRHPLLLELREKKEAIEIVSFRYQMLQYPKMEAPRDPYLAKVEMEFTTESALNARKFHEQLLSANGYVDSAREIGWESLENRYRVSFFLKTRTSHDL